MGKSFQDFLYLAQAKRVTALMEQVSRLEAENNSLKVGGHFYNALIKAIGDDITLQDEWRRFIGVLRLSNPDLPGITKAGSIFE